MSMISVIMPVFNGANTVAEAIGSVLKNGYDDLEVLVVDDCSTDTTLEVVQALAACDSRIRILQTDRNMGPAGARNLALAHARGEWITLNDADDWWVAGRLTSLLHEATVHHADVVLDNMLLYDHANGKVYDRTRFAGGRDRPISLTPDNIFYYDDIFNLTDRRYRYSSIGFSQPFIRKEFLAKNDIRYPIRYRTLEDIFFLVNMVMAGARTIVLREAYYIYRIPVSPSTGEKSPFSNTKIGLQCVDRLVSEMIDMYRDKLPPHLVRHFQYLKKKIHYKILLGEGEYYHVLRAFLSEPSVFVVIASRLLKRYIVELG